jgi:hypothetical protein
MPASYFTMWGMLILMALGAAGELFAHGNLFVSIREAYPADEIKRAALSRCGEMNAEFSRFSESDRDSCYRVILPPAEASSNAAGQ